MHIRSKLFYLYVCMAVLYAASFLGSRPISTFQSYELTSVQYRLLSLTVLVPLTLIWFTAFYGFAKLRAYSQKIASSSEGLHIARITTGIMVLAIGLPITSLVSATAGLITQHNPDAIGASVIIKNYVSVAVPLAGFIFLSWGARGLSTIAKRQPSYRATCLLMLTFAAISVAYCYIIFTNQDLATTYHMSKWLVAATLTVPYLCTWFLGIVAAYELHLYSRAVTGLLYHSAWNMLANGLGAILVMRVAIQYISIATAQFTEMRLLRLLLIIYVFEVLMSVGYILVALGAKRLQKIEEV